MQIEDYRMYDRGQAANPKIQVVTVTLTGSYICTIVHPLIVNH